MSHLNPVRRNVFVKASHHWMSDGPSQLRIHFIDTGVPTSQRLKATLLLIHGFPQTSHQFHRVIGPLAQKGYRVIVPDYRGAGQSSRPIESEGYRKHVMATDLHELIVNHLSIETPIHVIGHDIGGMIAHAYASLFPDDTHSLIWGECPLPGTTFFDELSHHPMTWHFTFHKVIDLPEFLVAGREAAYLNNFFARLTHNAAAFGPDDIAEYVREYSQPGAMRAAFTVYRLFDRDGEDNVEHVRKYGKSKVACMALNGDQSFTSEEKARAQAGEFYEDDVIQTAMVPDSGHYIAEENPEGFVLAVCTWLEKFRER